MRWNPRLGSSLGIATFPTVLWTLAFSLAAIGSHMSMVQVSQGFHVQELQGPYLGQTPPGTTPEIFAPNFVSTSAHEFSCSFSSDGTEFYFARRDPNQGIPLIMVTRLLDGAWTEPAVVPFVQNRMSFEPRVTPDGGRLYFTWQNPLPGQEGPPMDVWYVDREGDGWSQPRNPGPPLSPMKAMYVSLTQEGTIYTSDVSEGPGREGIATARMTDGEYGDLVRLGPPINIGAQDMYPYVAPDESYLIFASRRGSPDNLGTLFISFRAPNGQWSDPREIDLGMPAGLPLISPDGKYLFFTAGERGRSDIYWVEATFLEELRPGLEAEATGREAEIEEIRGTFESVIGWFENKDFDLLFSVVAHDSSYLSVHPTDRVVRGFDEFERNSEVFRNPEFTYVGHDLRDVVINVSRSGDVAWFFCVLDDINDLGGQPANWEDARWTGVLEKREGRWVVVQQHFSFPSS